PVFEPARVPFAAAATADRYEIVVGDERLDIGAVSMGNPHAVVAVNDLADPALQRLGPLLTNHPRFAQGANAGFVQRIDRSRLRLRVHERGAGWTRACGTGACAAMAVLHRRGDVDDSVAVELPGGTLRIDWAGPGHTLWMTGPAAFAFEGEWPVPVAGA
ncbi:MAG: diaminopimelate epimerase, partial [Rhodanobacter sp. RIFOXYA1_FULL_67_6]